MHRRDGQNALWNTIGKLVVLASKHADQEDKKLVMDSLEDYQINHGYMSSDLAKTNAGRQESCGHHSLVDFEVQGPPGLGEFLFHCCGALPARCGCLAREDQDAQ